MTSGRNSERECAASDAAARLTDARSFLDAALLFVEDSTDVAGSNAVLAGIAAADAVCCALLGRRSASGDHAAAVELLAQADSEAANRLRRLLRIRTKAQYSERNLTAGEVKTALRQAEVLVNVAEAAVAS